MRLYLDTSIFGGYFDNEFNKWTIPLFEEIKKKRHVVVISNVTIGELPLIDIRSPMEVISENQK
jgi:hypothetical protein